MQVILALLIKDALQRISSFHARWRTHLVFTDHYLCDIARKEDDVFALGPVVAAGDIVH